VGMENDKKKPRRLKKKEISLFAWRMPKK